MVREWSHEAARLRGSMAMQVLPPPADLRHHSVVQRKAWRRRSLRGWRRDEPPGHAIVVRGSHSNGAKMTVAKLRRAARRPMNQGRGYYGLSVFTLRRSSAEQIAARTIPHDFCCSSSAERLRNLIAGPRAACTRPLVRFRSLAGLTHHRPAPCAGCGCGRRPPARHRRSPNPTPARPTGDG